MQNILFFTIFGGVFLLQLVLALPVPDITCLNGCSSSFTDNSGVKRTNETNILQTELDAGAGLVGMDFTFGSFFNVFFLNFHSFKIF